MRSPDLNTKNSLGARLWEDRVSRRWLFDALGQAVELLGTRFQVCLAVSPIKTWLTLSAGRKNRKRELFFSIERGMIINDWFPILDDEVSVLLWSCCSGETDMFDIELLFWETLYSGFIPYLYCFICMGTSKWLFCGLHWDCCCYQFLVYPLASWRWIY